MNHSYLETIKDITLYPASTLLKANVPITSSASTPGTYHLMNLYQFYTHLNLSRYKSTTCLNDFYGHGLDGCFEVLKSLNNGIRSRRTIALVRRV
jgi:hypothetical protein